MKIPFALIVEGQGEEEALPVLLRRLLRRIDPRLALDVRIKLRVPANRLQKKGELERLVDFAANRGGPACRILILLDCDDHCPAHLGPELLRRAVQARRDRPVCVALAHREFETWFLGAARSLRGHRNLPRDLEPPIDPEKIRGAKEWLSRSMKAGFAYHETLDQAALAAVFDFEEAARIPSFARLERKLRALIEGPQPSA